MRPLLCCVVATLLCTRSFSQSLEPTQQPAAENDLLLYLRLTGQTLASPLHWRDEDWLTAGTVLAGTGVAGLLDNEIYDLMERNHSSFNDKLRQATVHYGSGITGVTVTAGMYAAGIAFENRWLRETSVLVASALSVSVATEFALKFMVGRARPYVNRGNSVFKPFNGKADFSSFPSGHTVVAFTLSTVLSERIKNTWASVGLYTLAALTATSRLYSRSHWFSDILFGGALSLYTARSVVHSFEKKMQGEEVSLASPAEGIHIGRVNVVLRMDGVALVWKF